MAANPLNPLNTLRELARFEKHCADYVRSLPKDQLRWIYEQIGIEKPPGEKKKVFAKSVRKKRRKLASIVPIEVHAIIMAILWPKIYAEPYPPRKSMQVTTAVEAVAVMTERAAAGRALRHRNDEVEITDRKRLFHRQGKQFVATDSTRRKNGRNKYKGTLSKRMLKSSAYYGDDADKIPVGDAHRGNLETSPSEGGTFHYAKAERFSSEGGYPIRTMAPAPRRIPKLAGLSKSERKEAVRDVVEILKGLRAKKKGGK